MGSSYEPVVYNPSHLATARIPIPRNHNPNYKNTWLSDYFNNIAYTPAMQVVVAFAYGILLGPLASGLFLLIVSLFFYEWLYYILTRGQPDMWQLETRVGVIMSSILGYIIGRTIVKAEVLKEGVPNVSAMWAKLNII